MKKFTKLLQIVIFFLLLSSVSFGQAVISAEAERKSETQMVDQETLRLKKEYLDAQAEQAALQEQVAMQTEATISNREENIFVEQQSDESLKNEIELSQEHFNLLVEHGLIQDHVLTFESVQQLEDILGAEQVREFKREHE